MNNKGFTVEPLIYTDEQGIEHLSYDHANVTDHSINADIREQHQRIQDSAITEDSLGNLTHEWADMADTDAQSEIASDVNQFIEQAIGMENYKSMLYWAGKTLPDNEIDSFNRIIDSGDQERMQDIIVSLFTVYQKANAQ